MAARHPYAILTCDVCGKIVASDAASGLLVFVRGDQIVYEEPPLCGDCGLAIGMTAMSRWAEEEEES